MNICSHGHDVTKQSPCTSCTPNAVRPKQPSPIMPQPSAKFVRYNLWLRYNPEIVDTALAIVGDKKAAGFKQYGGPAIAEDIRWHYQKKRGQEDFDFNNDFIPYLSRTVNNRLQEDYLEVRTSQADVDMHYVRWGTR
jgi:hypothetical protein